VAPAQKQIPYVALREADGDNCPGINQKELSCPHELPHAVFMLLPRWLVITLYLALLLALGMLIKWEYKKRRRKSLSDR